MARRIEQTSGSRLALNYGTLYPALLRLEQEGSLSSRWGLSGNNRKAKFYKRRSRTRPLRAWRVRLASLWPCARRAPLVNAARRIAQPHSYLQIFQ